MGIISDQIDWVKNGELADEVNLNRPLKGVVAIMEKDLITSDGKTTSDSVSVKYPSTMLGNGVSVERCVYIDNTGKFQLANASDDTKQPLGYIKNAESGKIRLFTSGEVKVEGNTLTAGEKYYLTNDGNISTTKSNVYLGVASSQNTLILCSLGAGGSGNGFKFIQEGIPKTNAKVGDLWLRPSTLEFFIMVSEDGEWMGSKGSFIKEGGYPPAVGEKGFGVGLAPTEIADSLNMTLLSSDPNNANYGNYTDSTGSVMVWIPKFYFRISYVTGDPYVGTRVDISYEPQDGYLLHRAFINDGKEMPGFFVDKYLMSAENKIGVSKAKKSPVTSGGSYGTELATAFSDKGFQNQNGYFLDACKTRGSNYALCTVFIYNALALLGDAYYQECYRKGTTSQIGWADVAPYQAKGNNNTLKDFNDTSVIYTQATGTYTSVGLTAGVSDANLAKITHNGEKNGVTDINGNLWEFSMGNCIQGGNSVGILKESVDVKTLTRENATNTSLYDTVTIPFDAKTQWSEKSHFGNGTDSPWGEMSTTSDDNYKMNCSGIASNANGISTAGTDRFGNDAIFVSSAADRFANCGGAYSEASGSGVWAGALNRSLSSSDQNRGCRACLYPQI